MIVTLAVPVNFVLPVLIGVSTAATTYVGGVFALRWRHRLNGLLGFGAGALLGVAAFDLFPEAIQLGASRVGVMAVVCSIVAGFALCFALYRLAPPHIHEDGIVDGIGEEISGATDRQMFDPRFPGFGHRNLLAVGSLALHSLMDGLESVWRLRYRLPLGSSLQSACWFTISRME